MPTAKGTWKFSSDESKSNRKHRNHHYTFDVNHNGVDINGFIVHHDKRGGKKEKKRVYLDSNENGRFDKDDLFLGCTGINERATRKGAGLDPGEIGHVEIQFKQSKNRSDVADAFDLSQIPVIQGADFRGPSLGPGTCLPPAMCVLGPKVFDLDSTQLTSLGI